MAKLKDENARASAASLFVLTERGGRQYVWVPTVGRDG